MTTIIMSYRYQYLYLYLFFQYLGVMHIFDSGNNGTIDNSESSNKITMSKGSNKSIRNQSDNLYEGNDDSNRKRILQKNSSENELN